MSTASDKQQPADPEPRRICPYMYKPFENCWFINMTSRTVIKVQQLCGGEYERCDVYLNNHNKL